MNRNLLKLLTGSCLLVLANAAHAAGQGQATPAPSKAQAGPGSEVEVVVVTARRRDESIQDVPAVVNAVTPEAIARLNMRDFTEVQNVVPGLSLTNNANGIGGNAQVRGVNFDVNASGNNPSVEFYQNDAPITAGVVLQQMYDIGQVEVLRGPQGTLRGRASPSGSITITTKKPDLYNAGGYGAFTANTNASWTPSAAGLSLARTWTTWLCPPLSSRNPRLRKASSVAPRATTLTSCPARASRAAKKPPIAPAPTIPIFIQLVFHGAARAKAPSIRRPPAPRHCEPA